MHRANNKTRLAFAGLKAGDAGSFDYGRNYGLVYDAIGVHRYAARIRWRYQQQR